MSAKERLLEAAASLAASEGVTSLGVDRVVHEAGVSKGSFFYHFETKEKMIGALFAHISSRCMEEVDQAVARGARFTDAFVDMVARDLQDNGELIAVIIAAVALDPALRLVLTRHSEQIFKRMTKEDGVPEEKAQLIQLVIDGALIGTHLYQPEQRVDRAKIAVRALRSILDNRFESSLVK